MSEPNTLEIEAAERIANELAKLGITGYIRFEQAKSKIADIIKQTVDDATEGLVIMIRGAMNVEKERMAEIAEKDAEIERLRKIQSAVVKMAAICRGHNYSCETCAKAPGVARSHCAVMVKLAQQEKQA